MKWSGRWLTWNENMCARLVGAEQVDVVACCTLVTTTMARTTLAEDVSHNASVWPYGHE